MQNERLNPLRRLKLGWVILMLVTFSGCATLFGWEIHGPGRLSAEYYSRMTTVPGRVALLLEPSLEAYLSEDRGGRFADPQMYFVGESFAPMLLEGFQQGFSEFIFMEVEPTPEIMTYYNIDYLAAVRIKEFGNRVTLKGQALQLRSELILLDKSLNELVRVEALGTSDAKRVFAKRGGPEVNLNAALENNVLAIVQFIQDGLDQGFAGMGYVK